MEFHFCDRCGCKITEDELDEGTALMMGEQYFCAKCKDAALADVASSSTERAAAPVAAGGRSKRSKTSGPKSGVRTGRTTGPRKPVGLRKSGLRAAAGGAPSGRRSDRMRAVAPEQAKSKAPIIVGAAAAGVVIIVAAVVMMGGGEERKQRPKQAEPPTKAAEPPVVKTAEPPVVKAQSVGVPEGSKGANDFPVTESAEAPGPGANVLKLVTGETPFEVQAARASQGWTVFRSADAKREGSRGYRVTPDPAKGAKASTENSFAVVLSRPADISEYEKLGLWIGGKNVKENLAKVTMVVGEVETSLTGTTPVSYGTQWKFYSFDLVGKRDEFRGLILHFNSSEPPSAATFELWMDEVVAYGGKTEVAAAPTAPTPLGPGPAGPRPPRPRPPAVEEEPETTTRPAVPGPRPPRPRPPAVEEPETPATPGTPATPAPAMPGGTGDLSVIYRETFDGGGKFYWSADLEKTNTYGGSAGAAAAQQKPNGQFYACGIGLEHWQLPRPMRKIEGGLFKAEEDVWVSFQYYLTGHDVIKLWPRTKEVGKCNNVVLKNCIQGKWTAVAFKSMEMNVAFGNENKGKSRPGHTISQFSITAGAPKQAGVNLIIDNFTVTKGSPPGDIERQVAAAKRTTAEMTADSKKEGFSLLPRVIANLKQHYKADKVTQGKVLKVGGDSATSMFHIGSIKGITAVKRFTVCGKMKGAADVSEKFPKELAGQKPEIVTIMFGVGDLAKNRASMEARSHYITIIEKTLEAGAIPVLFTLPLRLTSNKEMDKLIGEYNKMIIKLGEEKSVPVIDAHGILLRDLDKMSKYFGTGFKLKKDGLEAINAGFKDLYDRLSKHVAGRK